MRPAGCPTQSVLKPEPPPRQESPWRTAALRYVALPLFVLALYLLSFGPARRPYLRPIWGETGVPGVHVIVRCDVESPHWFYLLYCPAFWLSWAAWADSTYGAYLRWWEPRN